jgi:hypothetical protein
LVEAGLQAESFADDGDQDVDVDGDPDLGLDCVFAGAEEALDAQMLLDPFEKQGDILPINIAQTKSQSSILSTRCARTGYR